MTQTTFTPNYGYAILKAVETTKTHGNIIVPDMGKEKATVGEIIDFKPTYNFNTDTLVPFLYEIGDEVIFASMGGKKVKIDRQEYIVISINDILTKI
jgi:co-chaperonin GroES (HSP10)